MIKWFCKGWLPFINSRVARERERERERPSPREKERRLISDSLNVAAFFALLTLLQGCLQAADGAREAPRDFRHGFSIQLPSPSARPPWKIVKQNGSAAVVVVVIVMISLPPRHFSHRRGLSEFKALPFPLSERRTIPAPLPPRTPSTETPLSH